MKKKTKILVCALAALSTLSFVGCGGVKDWFDDKLNGKDDTCVHADVDYDNVCDHCGVATTFEEVLIVEGEQATGNWYRLYNYTKEGSSTAKVGTICITDGVSDFYLTTDAGLYENSYLAPFGIRTYTTMPPPLADIDALTFHNIISENSEGQFLYADVYMEHGATFTIYCQRTTSGAPETYEYTFTLDDSFTIKHFSFANRLQVVAALPECDV